MSAAHKDHDESHDEETKKGGKDKKEFTPTTGELKPIASWGAIIGGILFVTLIALIFRGCTWFDGKDEEEDCFENVMEKIEFKRAMTPITFTEENFPLYWQLDSFGPVYYQRPNNNGTYTPIPYPGGGVDVDFDKEYGPRGHGDVKFTSQDPNHEVEVIIYKREWRQVPCKDRD